ncbi:MAG: 5-deoxy-glucuronate isomerase [Haliea sp.]
MDDFYAARTANMAALPWSNFAPPFSDGKLDETMAVADGDVVCVPRGHHPCGAPYGFEMYYLNVMAGPLRKWRFVPAPDVAWIIERDV